MDAPEDPLPDGFDVVTVGRYLNFIEARIHWSLLRSEGLEASIADEHTAVSYNYAQHAIGGIRLQVPQSQLAAARQILQEVRSGQRRLDEGQDFGELTQAPLPAPGGPVTRGEHITGLLLLLSLLAGLLTWFFYARP